MHRNPENVNYILKPGTLRLTGADGTVQDVELTEGQVIPPPSARMPLRILATRKCKR